MASTPEPLVLADQKAVEARKLIAEGSFDPAIELLATALELRCMPALSRPGPHTHYSVLVLTRTPPFCSIGVHGDEHSDCAGAYAEYAKALLRKVQSEGDPFGSAGPKPEAKSAPASEGEAGPSSVTAEDAAAGDEAAGEGEGGGDDEEEGGDDDDAEEGEASDEADDLELAFQCFEVARLAYEEKPGEKLPLAEVLECLGEVHMENEHWTDAVSEFERSLSIKKGVLPAGDRQLAHLHFLMAQASVAHMDDLLRDPDADRGGDPADGSSSSAMTPEATAAAAATQRAQARSHYEACAEVFELRLQLLTQSAAPAAAAADAPADAAAAPSESDDLRELLAEVREKATELAGAPETASTAAAAAAAGAAAGTAAAAAASDGAAATTTSGFDAPRCGISAAGVTTVGFGAGASAGGGATTTVGFGGGAAAGKASAAPVQIIAGRKKAVLVPLSTNKSEGAAAAAPTKAAREAEPAEGAEAKKARLQ